MSKAAEIIEKYQKMNITELIEKYPQDLYADAIQLAASFPEWTAQTLLAEQALAKTWEELRKGSDTDGRADKLIKATQEYADVQLCRAYEKSCLELLRSLKSCLRSKAEESHNNF